MNEFQFIKTLKDIPSHHNITLGIADDAAVIGSQLICSDTLVEGTHFSLDYFSLKQVITKSIMVNISDIVAMNGTPQYYLMNLTLPKNRELPLCEISDAVKEINCNYKIDLIGGDTTSSKDCLMISITMIGQSDHPIYRQGAKPGNFIYIGGQVGGSALGLNTFLNQSPETGYEQYHLSPVVDLTFLKLFKELVPSAMIDISDGILNDLSHILDASDVGAHIDTNCFQEYFPDFYQATDHPLNLILNGGEDFVPLFTSSIKPDQAIIFAQKYDLPLYHIGEIISEKGIINQDNQILTPKGYLHF